VCLREEDEEFIAKKGSFIEMRQVLKDGELGFEIISEKYLMEFLKEA